VAARRPAARAPPVQMSLPPVLGLSRSLLEAADERHSPKASPKPSKRQAKAARQVCPALSDYNSNEGTDHSRAGQRRREIRRKVLPAVGGSAGIYLASETMC
jgi:hypothetical protein